MAVDDPLGVASRTRGIAHRGRRALSEFRPGIVRRLAADEGFVIDGGLKFARSIGSLAHNDIELHRRQLLSHTLQQRHQVAIDKDHLVLGIVDDKGELLSEQTQVERVQDRSQTRNGKIQLQVTIRVPAEGCDAVAWLCACLVQRIGQLHHALSPLGVRVAVFALCGQRDHFFAGKQVYSSIEGVLQGQRVIHH